MLNRYSLFGTTLELIVVAGVFFILFAGIVLTAWLQWGRRKKRVASEAGQSERRLP
ncbi:hypothetical protein SAMN04487970_100866 [Paenibacillus tianmuensis]|uniref:Uncharacterized protein n=1 Tax=Paenibacillus tianmuensis TaxID=624147 RepID=A0A1G4QPJ5_9BACL|nr:hypothetical protein [Paenibacillus tianmuensis]SCW46341.1 hypothetical protein SAMN04487970_100866 [Paenibacillus tianmuensis]